MNYVDGIGSGNSLQISVLMSVYNDAQYLHQAVQSILKQTFRNFEFIIIEDGSDDGSLEILEYYKKIDSRIRLFPQKNHGLIYSLNKGLSLCRSKWVARMDSDDVSDLNRLKTQVQFLRCNQNIDVLGGQVKVIDPAGNNLGLRIYPCEHSDIVENLLSACCISHPTVIYKRQKVEKIGGYRKEALHAEDYDLWLRMLGDGARFANVPEYLLSYREDPSGSVSKVYASEQADTADESRKKILRHLRKSNELSNVDLLNAMARYPEVAGRRAGLDPLWKEFEECCDIARELDVLMLKAIAGTSKSWKAISEYFFRSGKDFLGHLSALRDSEKPLPPPPFLKVLRPIEEGNDVHVLCLEGLGKNVPNQQLDKIQEVLGDRKIVTHRIRYPEEANHSFGDALYKTFLKINSGLILYLGPKNKMSINGKDSILVPKFSMKKWLYRSTLVFSDPFSSASQDKFLHCTWPGSGLSYFGAPLSQFLHPALFAGSLVPNLKEFGHFADYAWCSHLKIFSAKDNNIWSSVCKLKQPPTKNRIELVFYEKLMEWAKYTVYGANKQLAISLKVRDKKNIENWLRFLESLCGFGLEINADLQRLIRSSLIMFPDLFFLKEVFEASVRNNRGEAVKEFIKGRNFLLALKSFKCVDS